MFLYPLRCHAAWCRASNSRTSSSCMRGPMGQIRDQSLSEGAQPAQSLHSEPRASLAFFLCFIQHLFTWSLINKDLEMTCNLTSQNSTCQLPFSPVSRFYQYTDLTPPSGPLRALFSCSPCIAETLLPSGSQLKCLLFTKDLSDHPISSPYPSQMSL